MAFLVGVGFVIATPTQSPSGAQEYLMSLSDGARGHPPPLLAFRRSVESPGKRSRGFLDKRARPNSASLAIADRLPRGPPCVG